MSENKKGSYNFSELKDKSSELARLEMQVGLDLRAEQEMWKLAGLQDGMSVLDVGCGPGIVACSMAHLYPNSSVLGVDQSTELLAHAVTNQTNCGLKNVRFRQGSIYNLSLPEASVDFVLARLIFQHLDNPLQALESVHRVLKPGGRLCLIDIDDQFFVLHPKPQMLEQINHEAQLAQQNQGGNRKIGREIFGLLCTAGFAKRETYVHTISSIQSGMKKFLDVTLRFKLRKIAPNSLDHMALAEFEQDLNKLEQSEDAWGAMSVFIGVGTKG